MPTVDELPADAEGAADGAAGAQPKEDATEKPPMLRTVPPPSELSPVDGEDDDDDLDETLGERLLGLSEMFPESVRNITSGVVSFSWNGASWLYNAGRVAAWVVASSAVILALPVMFESERAQMEEQQLQEQRQILLGPNAAVSGAGGAHPGLMPGSMPQVAPPPR